MPESEDRSAEAQVLVFFALLMESVQKFEWSLKTLTIQRDESMNDLDFDEAWKRALRAMRKPIGALEGRVSQGLADEVGELRGLRNKIAHEVLLLWRIETRLGRVDHATVAQGLFQSAERDDCRAEVDALTERHLRALGIYPSDLQLEHDDLKAILQKDGGPLGEVAEDE